MKTYNKTASALVAFTTAGLLAVSLTGCDPKGYKKDLKRRSYSGIAANDQVTDKVVDEMDRTCAEHFPLTEYYKIRVEVNSTNNHAMKNGVIMDMYPRSGVIRIGQPLTTSVSDGVKGAIKKAAGKSCDVLYNLDGRKHTRDYDERVGHKTPNNDQLVGTYFNKKDFVPGY